MSLFHAYCHLESGPIEFDPADAQVFYDDASGYLVVYRDGTFFVSPVHSREIQAQKIDFIRRAPVIGVRFSMDKRHVAVQRSHTDVDVINLLDRSEVTVSCKGKGQGNMVHGFFWCNTSLCDIVLVTLTGVELLKASSGSGDPYKLVKHDKRPICWYHYLHQARLLVLCTGKDYGTIQCFQFAPSKLIKLPDFDPEQGSNGRRARLEGRDFVPCRLYDKLCCLQISAARQELIVYQLGQGAIGRLCTINLFTSSDNFTVSVLDSLLVVHGSDSRITMIFDIRLHQWTSHPIVAPLPLGGPPPEGAEGGGGGEGGEGLLFSPAEQVVKDWQVTIPRHSFLDTLDYTLYAILSTLYTIHYAL
jgi:hypothetical protein